jgi:hypothetical protein
VKLQEGLDEVASCVFHFLGKATNEKELMFFDTCHGQSMNINVSMEYRLSIYVCKPYVCASLWSELLHVCFLIRYLRFYL